MRRRTQEAVAGQQARSAAGNRILRKPLADQPSGGHLRTALLSERARSRSGVPPSSAFTLGDQGFTRGPRGGSRAPQKLQSISVRSQACSTPTSTDTEVTARSAATLCSADLQPQSGALAPASDSLPSALVNLGDLVDSNDRRSVAAAATEQEQVSGSAMARLHSQAPLAPSLTLMVRSCTPWQPNPAANLRLTRRPSMLTMLRGASSAGLTPQLVQRIEEHPPAPLRPRITHSCSATHRAAVASSVPAATPQTPLSAARRRSARMPRSGEVLAARMAARAAVPFAQALSPLRLPRVFPPILVDPAGTGCRQFDRTLRHPRTLLTASLPARAHTEASKLRRHAVATLSGSTSAPTLPVKFPITAEEQAASTLRPLQGPVAASPIARDALAPGQHAPFLRENGGRLAFHAHYRAAHAELPRITLPAGALPPCGAAGGDAQLVPEHSASVSGPRMQRSPEPVRRIVASSVQRAERRHQHAGGTAQVTARMRAFAQAAEAGMGERGACCADPLAPAWLSRRPCFGQTH